MKLPLYTIQGEKKGTVEVPENIFAVKASPELIHQVVVGAQSNLRKPYAHTKDRSEVSGGGRKPWKQKGTGRARHGSIRSPLWVGGGVAFGPTKERNFHKKINKKMNRKAMFAELSEKVAKNAICVAEELQFEDAKTKHGAMFLQQVVGSLSPKMKVSSNSGVDENRKIDKKKALGSVVIWGTSIDQNFSRVFSNIPHVDTRRIENINILDVMSHRYAIFSQSALENFVGAMTKGPALMQEAKQEEKAPRAKTQLTKHKSQTKHKLQSTKHK